MAVAALHIPFCDPVVLGKLKSMQEYSYSIITCTIHILGRYLLFSGAFRSLCNTILSTAIWCLVFLRPSTATFSSSGAKTSLFQ